MALRDSCQFRKLLGKTFATSGLMSTKLVPCWCALKYLPRTPLPRSSRLYNGRSSSDSLTFLINSPLSAVHQTRVYDPCISKTLHFRTHDFSGPHITSFCQYLSPFFPDLSPTVFHFRNMTLRDSFAEVANKECKLFMKMSRRFLSFQEGNLCNHRTLLFYFRFITVLCWGSCFTPTYKLNPCQTGNGAATGKSDIFELFSNELGAKIMVFAYQAVEDLIRGKEAVIYFRPKPRNCSDC